MGKARLESDQDSGWMKATISFDNGALLSEEHAKNTLTGLSKLADIDAQYEFKNYRKNRKSISICFREKQQPTIVDQATK